MHERSADWQRTPGHGRYAHPERERRFRVVGESPDAGPSRRIEDHYVEGLRLRLRRVSDGDRTAYKLTQKVRSDPADSTTVSITNLYLEAAEYERLRALLPGRRLVKTRTPAGAGLVVDVFGGDLTGLRLAEVEVASLDAPLSLPAWVGDEVTADDRFSGGRLATATPAEVAALLAPG